MNDATKGYRQALMKLSPEDRRPILAALTNSAITAIHPEHLRLMRAVCDAAAAGHTWDLPCPLCAALDALAAWEEANTDE